jgi:uncharacterized protein YecE (DUF72 family)
MEIPYGGRLRLGTCSWNTKDWVGKVYTPGTAPTEFIREYAQQFDAVEIDSTFYGIPRERTVDGWRERTPEGFVFAAKAPKSITHDLFLQNCETELSHFLGVMSRLGERLGPIEFQFPYFAKRSGVTCADFLARLEPFLKGLPEDGFQFAVEVRNRAWLRPPLLELLGERGITLVLIDHPWMARPDELFRRNVVTGAFLYIRFLGDRRGIEKITSFWGESVIDRRPDIQQWVPHIKRLLDQQVSVYGFVNSHYSGHAPHDVELLREALAGQDAAS